MLPWHDTGMYDNPQVFDLELIRSVDVAGSYEFDIIAIWKDKDGRYLIGHDTGCSCPVPFENTRVDELVEVKTLADVAAFAREWWPEPYYAKNEIETGVADLVSSLSLG